MPNFPDSIFADNGVFADAYFEQLWHASKTVDRAAVAAAGKLLAAQAEKGHVIFSCGNGGSAAISNHLVCDCLKGVRTSGWLRPKVNSLSNAVELLTAIVNDIGPEQMFSFQLESQASAGDVLVAISSSGASPNIVSAIRKARDLGMSTIAMTGFSGGDAARLADISLHVEAHNYGVVEDVHQSLMHILAQYMRQTHLEDPAQIGRIKF